MHQKKIGKTVITAILITLIALSATLIAAPALAEMGVDPATVEVTLYPGESTTLTKTVTTPTYPPVLDMLLLEDETGSFWDDIKLMQGDPPPGLAEQIWDGITGEVADFRGAVAGFRDFPTGAEGYTPWGSPGDWIYRLPADFTDEKTTWMTGINALTAGGGADIPESQYAALICGATGGSWTYEGVTYTGAPPDWREDATKVIVLVTDAPPHVNGDSGGWPGPSYADTVTALEGFHVIALSTNTLWYQAIADATGGSTKPISSDSSDIVEAIMAALEEITTDVWGEHTCPPGITITFDPEYHENVAGDTSVQFEETIHVDNSVEPGEYTCTVEFYANTYGGNGGTLLGTQTITVTVEPIPVDIDIKPWSYPNSINTKNKGVIPVAILGSDTLDVATIDPSTLVFAGAPTVHTAMEDVNEDGYTDLISHYNTQETDIVVGQEQACITGKFYDLRTFEGCDSIRVLK